MYLKQNIAGGTEMSNEAYAQLTKQIYSNKTSFTCARVISRL